MLKAALLVSLIFSFPFLVASPYVVGVMCFIAIYGTLAIGKTLLLEHAGVFSLAHPVWLLIGAYGTGIAAISGVPPVFAALIAAAMVGGLAYVISAPLLRLQGIYLICATFCLIIILEIVIVNMGGVTGGHDGLTNIPPLSIGGYIIKGDTSFYILSWSLCLGTLWFCNNLLHSREGRAMRASRDSEVAATSMGIDVSRYKLKVFVITAVMASFAGSILCFWLRYISVEFGGFTLMIELITMMIIGGGYKLYGPLLGAGAVMWLRELIHVYSGRLMPQVTAEVDSIFFGLIIVLILMFMPGGLIGWVDQLRSVINYRRSERKLGERLAP